MSQDKTTAGREYGVLEDIPMGVFIVRRDFVVLFWNRCMEAWTGIKQEEITGRPVDSFFPHLSEPRYTMRLADIFDGGPPAVFSSQLHKYIIPALLPEGQQRIQHTSVTAIEARDASSFHALFVIQDVTELTYRIQSYRTMRDQAVEEVKARVKAEQKLLDAHNQLEHRVRERTEDLLILTERLQEEITERRSAEESLRRSEKLLRSIFDNVSVGIALLDGSGSILTMNEACCRILGYGKGEVAGRLFFDFFPTEDRETEYREFSRIISGEKKSHVADIRFINSAGMTVWGRLTVSNIGCDRTADRSAVVVCEDITARKRAEGELLRTQKLEAVGLLAGGIAHDFNNLLTAILGNISTVRRYASKDDDMHIRLGDAEKASLRARELTRQFLTFSKGGAPIRKTASIGELIRESANMIVRGAGAKCNFSIAADLWPVQADEGQINQVINNLVINALEAMPEGGALEIQADNIRLDAESGFPLKDGDYVKISVRDQGPGIPDEIAEKIFDPYFTTKPEGTGLGLSTSYSIIKNHNGYIGIDSRPGSGTTFSIYLPASENRTVAAAKKDLPLPGKGRVLVMDDEKIIRTAAGLMLNDLGYAAEFARDGQEALEIYQKAKESECPFDAVIIDLTVRGGMGGKETIRKLVEIDPGIKAIVSSGYSQDPIMANYSHYGFCGVVEKPYTLNELSHVLDRVISRSVQAMGGASD